MGMLDRPISEFDGPVDSVGVPVLLPVMVIDDCKPFQEVLIKLTSRLNKSPVFVDENGNRKYKDYPDFIINYETAKDLDIGYLAGWRSAAMWRTSWFSREVIALPSAIEVILVYGLIHYLNIDTVLFDINDKISITLSLIIGSVPYYR